MLLYLRISCSSLSSVSLVLSRTRNGSCKPPQYMYLLSTTSMLCYESCSPATTFALLIRAIRSVTAKKPSPRSQQHHGVERVVGHAGVVLGHPFASVGEQALGEADDPGMARNFLATRERIFSSGCIFQKARGSASRFGTDLKVPALFLTLITMDG